MSTRIFSGGPWEDRYGYARAVVAGPRVWVSGCTATVDGEVRHVGDAYRQMLTAISIALDAIGKAGGSLQDVVRTRIFLVKAEDFDAVGRAHGEVFGAVRPACTSIQVAGLVDPRMLVEVEVEAYLNNGTREERSEEAP
ncbi:RidA family protein [Microtetraspora sp. AC03309]|uniref:RidA family protein n=1 Tax=Microtetraspora sp. AC03309 TaxID=2779376 RepID=UPI001E62A824|nr:RidA family protein [Microtetraspora sp. AC03309]MCC5575577.1 RidA family protein [Microtetraspora sp. AC03309]